MKAIIITDQDAKALLEKLELSALRKDGGLLGVDEVLIERMHRQFHFIVCRWLQDQGADVTS